MIEHRDPLEIIGELRSHRNGDPQARSTDLADAIQCRMIEHVTVMRWSR